MRPKPISFTLVLLTAVCARAESDLNVVVILDNSGSMNERMPGGGSRIEAAKRSLLTVLEQTPAEAQVGVVLLNPPKIGEDWLLRLGPIDRTGVQRAVANIRAGGPTPLGASLKLATDSLLALRDKQRYGTYKLLIVSDGEATDQALVQRYLPEVQARGVQLDVIGVSMGQQHSLAQRANTYRNAGDPASLEKAISEVVLGESSDDGGDAGESDFEVLEGFPVELAAESLAALTVLPNSPIGEGPAPRIADPLVTPPNQPWQAAPPQQPAPNGRGNGGGMMRTLFIVFFIAMVLFNLLAKAKKSH